MLSQGNRVNNSGICSFGNPYCFFDYCSLSLAQSVQTATFVNNLAQNVSVTLGTQEDIDKKLEDRLNALYDVVKFLGEEVQSIKLRLRVQCHADFRWICYPPKI